MGIFGFLPKQDRCCFCTRKLKVACIFISISSMMLSCVLIALVLYPRCTDVCSGGKLIYVMDIFKWFLFINLLVMLSSSFAFLLGIFWNKYETADVYIAVSFSVMAFIILYIFFYSLQMVYINCSNPNDVLVCLIFLALLVYYVIIVSSYRESMEQK